jgi:hypothetical protein
MDIAEVNPHQSACGFCDEWVQDGVGEELAGGRPNVQYPVQPHGDSILRPEDDDLQVKRLCRQALYLQRSKLGGDRRFHADVMFVSIFNCLYVVVV